MPALKSTSLASQHGFTLIELVVVIMLLGILAATALPRFINLKGVARQAVIENVAGSIHSFDQQVYLKSVILGIQDNDRNPSTTDTNLQGGFNLNGEFIWTIHGRPWLFDGSTLSNLLVADIQYEGLNNRNQVCNSSKDFCAMQFNGGAASTNVGVSFQPGGAIVIYFPNDAVSDNCYAYHIFDRTNDSSIIGAITTGCN